MINFKKPVFAFFILLCVTAVVLLTMHFESTRLEKNETGQELNVENHDREETESSAYGVKEDEHAGGQDNEQGHSDLDEHGIQFDSNLMKEYGIKIATASPGILHVNANFPGEVVLNPERISHILPYVPGIIREVHKKLGDRVSSK